MNEETVSDNIQEARNRCEFASNLLKEANIPYEIKKRDIGHINLYHNGKVVMSFWARTGRFIFTMNVHELEKTCRKELDLDPDFDRGIRKCIKVYKKVFGGGNND